MAEGFDPDEADRHKNILQWLKGVQMASQQVPQVRPTILVYEVMNLEQAV